MPWSVAAAVGAAVVGGVASNKAAKKGAAAQDRATEAGAWQGEIAREQYDDYKETYQPLEQSIVRDASNYDSEANREKAAADAQATVSTQIGMAQERLNRTPGLDPSSAAAQAAHTNLALKGAALGANAQNAARENVKTQAYARKFDAVGLGKGLVTNAANGAAQVAATSQAAANAQAAQAGQTAAGIGSAVTGIANAAMKADWNKVGGLFGGSSSSGGANLHDNNPGAGANGWVDWSNG